VQTDHSHGSVSVLVYHSVPEVMLPALKSQLTWLAERYTFITPNTFHSFISGKTTLSGRQILVTFDDGFLSSFIATRKVLDPLHIKALFFIPSAFPDLREKSAWRTYVSNNFFRGRLPAESFSDDEKPMSWDEIDILVENGHQIGAHTISHLRLSDTDDPEQLDRELTDSKIRLEEHLNIPMEVLAYPFGTIGSIHSLALERISKLYRYCHSGIRGINDKNTNPLAIRREMVSLEDPPNYVGFLVEGGLDKRYKNERKRLDGWVS
jgi:peptidoglycan/xylan/chitin deacetylase (PgdA/CDA1 family)